MADGNALLKLVNPEQETKVGKRDYDTTLARMAGNIAASLATRWDSEVVAQYAVRLARDILAEIKRTEPKDVEVKG